MVQFLKCFAGCFICLFWVCAVYAQPNLTRVEYYIDTDPGYGNATLVNFSPGKNLANLTVQIDPKTVSAGAHTVGIRARDANGAWSIDNKWLFVKQAAPVAVPNIVKAEYYVDADPGYDNAKAISITPAVNLVNLAQNVKTDTLTPGAHLLGIRVKDAKGAWSLDNKWLFIKGATTPAITNIVTAEYYVDADPGYGNAKPINITRGTNVSNFTLGITTDTLSAGAHLIGIRAKDAKGAWSLDNKWLFVKQAVAKKVPALTQVECYIDTDPGYGKAIPVAINPVTGLADFNLPVNVTGLTQGAHIIGIRSKDANGAWSLDNKFQFSIISTIAAPALVVNSVPSKEMCAGTAFNMSYHATGMNDNNVFTVELSDAKGSFANPQVVGSFAGKTSTIINCKLPKHAPEGKAYRVRVVSSSPVVTGIVQEDSITVHNRPFVGNDTAVFIVCRGETASLDKVYNTTGFITAWDTTNITHLGEGVYGLRVTGTNGCNDTVYATIKQDVATWVGKVSDNWQTAANWSTGRVPTEKTHVIIPASTPNNCNINTVDAQAASLQLKTGARWNVTGNHKVNIKANCKPLPNSSPGTITQ